MGGSKSQNSRYFTAQSVENFIENLSMDRQAFLAFKEQAIKKGIIGNESLPKLHHSYYNKYIKPVNESSLRTSHNASKMSGYS